MQMDDTFTQSYNLLNGVGHFSFIVWHRGIVLYKNGYCATHFDNGNLTCLSLSDEKYRFCNWLSAIFGV